MTQFDLGRFIDAQAGVHETALAELRAGAKRSHWMWFVFPQMRGLGLSPMAHRYGIVSLDEAKAYLAHPVLGPRLRACTQAVLDSGERDPRTLFGSPDDMKFRSSMTLFALADGGSGLFAHVIDLLLDGAKDERTLKLLGV